MKTTIVATVSFLEDSNETLLSLLASH